MLLGVIATKLLPSSAEDAAAALFSCANEASAFAIAIFAALLSALKENKMKHFITYCREGRATLRTKLTLEHEMKLLK